MTRRLLTTVGLAAALVACCAGPTLIASAAAAGVVGVVGGIVRNPWIIGAAVALALIALTAVRLHSRRRPRSGACAIPDPQHHRPPGPAR